MRVEWIRVKLLKSRSGWGGVEASVVEVAAEVVVDVVVEVSHWDSVGGVGE